MRKILLGCAILSAMFITLAMSGCTSLTKIEATLEKDAPQIKADETMAATVGGAVNTIIQATAPGSTTAAYSAIGAQVLTDVNGVVQKIVITPVAPPVQTPVVTPPAPAVIVPAPAPVVPPPAPAVGMNDAEYRTERDYRIVLR